MVLTGIGAVVAVMAIETAVGIVENAAPENHALRALGVGV
jgi:hypothetical protein